MAETFLESNVAEQQKARGRRRRQRSARSPKPTHQQQAILEQAAQEGWLGGPKDSRITGRVPRKLIEAARARGPSFGSDTELVTYALAKVALEDDFGEVLLSPKGTVSPDLDLEF